MSENRDSRKLSLLEGLGLLILLLLALLVVPGLLLVYGVDQWFRLGLDRGQVWSFGGLAAFLVYAAVAAWRGSWRGAFGAYLALSAAMATAWGVACWGLHAAWPVALWEVLFGK